MRYQYCSMKPGFDHGSDIITKKINEEERHKEFCFKKIMRVVSLHYNKCAMFITCTYVYFSVPEFSCGYLHAHICTSFNCCSVWNCHCYRSKNGPVSPFHSWT